MQPSRRIRPIRATVFASQLPQSSSRLAQLLSDRSFRALAFTTVIAMLVSGSVLSAALARAADDTIVMSTSPTLANIQSFITANDRVGRTLKITLDSDLVIASNYTRKRVQTSAANTYGTIFGHTDTGIADGTGWGAVLGHLEINANGHSITNNSPLSYLTKLGRSGGSFTFYNGTYDGGGVGGLIATIDASMRDLADTTSQHPNIGKEPAVFIGKAGFDTTVKNSNFQGTVSSNHGQAVAIRTGSLDVVRTRFEHNTTVTDASNLSGGAIGIVMVDARKDQRVTITDSSFVRNTAHSDALFGTTVTGGAIGIRMTTTKNAEMVTISRTTFEGNTVSARGGIAAGGAIGMDPTAGSSAPTAILNIDNTTFADNEARMLGAGSSFGGAIASTIGQSKTSTSCVNCTLTGNRSIVLGSSAESGGDTDADLQNSTARGGAIDLETANGTLSVERSNFSKNTAENPFAPQNGSGGAIGAMQALLPKITLSQSAFSDNVASAAATTEILPSASAAWPKVNLQTVYEANVVGSTTNTAGPANGQLYNNWDVAYAAEGVAAFGNTGASTVKGHSADVVMLLPKDKLDAYGYTTEDLASVVQASGEFWMQATYGAISDFTVNQSIKAVSAYNACQKDTDDSLIYVNKSLSEAAAAVAPGRTSGYYNSSARSTHLIVFIDTGSACGGSEIGVGGIYSLHAGGWVRENMSRAGNQQDAQTMVNGVVHEMGHNLGLWHSMSRKCTAPYFDGLISHSVPPAGYTNRTTRYWADPSNHPAAASNAIDGACEDISYGDVWSALGGQRPSTLMGGSLVGPTVLQQYAMGVLPKDATTEVSVAGGVSQTFTLNAAGLNSGLVGLYVTSPVANGDKRYNFTVEYRNSAGIDAKSLITNTPVMNSNGGGYVTDGVRLVKTNGSLDNRQTVLIQGRHADGASYAAMRPGDSLIPLGEAVRVTPVSPVMSRYDRSTEVRIDFRAFTEPKTVTIAKSHTAVAGQAAEGETAAPQLGDLLTAKLDGKWNVNFGGLPSTVTESAQWYRDGEPIAGANEISYTLSEADVEADITVRITPSAAAGWATTPEAVAVSPAVFVAAPVVEDEPDIDFDTDPAAACTVEDGGTATEPATSSVEITGVTASIVYGDGPYLLALAGMAEGADVHFVSSVPEVAELTGNTLTVLKAGTTCLSATVAADSSQEAAQAHLTITVAPAQPVIEVTARGGTAPHDPIELTATVIAPVGATQPLTGGTVRFYDNDVAIGTAQAVSGSGEATLQIDAPARGAHSFHAVYSGLAEYYLKATSAKCETITVPGTPQAGFSVVAPTDAETVYGNVPFTLRSSGRLGTGRVSWSVPAENDVATVDPATGIVTILSAGTVKVTATLAGDAEYDPATATLTLTILRRAVTITALDAQTKFGEIDAALAWTANPTIIGNDLLAGSLALADGPAFGERAIIEGERFAHPNYLVTFVPGVLTVDPNEAQEEVIAQIAQLHLPIDTLAKADTVAEVSNAVNALSDAEQAALPQSVTDRLRTAQSQAGVTNHVSPADGVSVFSETLPWHVRVIVAELNGGPAQENFAAQLPEDRSLIKLYDIHLVDTLSHASWQPAPGDRVEVELSKVQLAAHSTIQVQHLSASAKFETVTSQTSTTKIRFGATSFSLYGVTGVLKTQSDQAPGDTPGSGNSSKDGLPGTGGDEIPLAVWLATFIALFAGAGLFARRTTRASVASK